MHENPSDFIDSEKKKKKKQRRWCIDKALNLAEKRKTQEEKTDMDSEDVVKAAENFNEFIDKEEKEK